MPPDPLPPDSLPPVPVLEVPPTLRAAVFSAHAEPARLALLVASARRTYTPLGLRLADARTRVWAARLDSPYAAEVAAVEREMARPGAYLLNHAYEWGCTTGAADDPALGGATLWRTLDWPFDGLGRALVATRQSGAAGPYMSLTWPGFAGVLTALAPGRFAGAINQPPSLRSGWGRAAGWLAARRSVGLSRALPPAHLLRLAFDTCRDFAEALALLRRTPICLPAIFTLAGPEPGEAQVIERTETGCFEPAAAVAANHWASAPGPPGRPRNASSHARRAAMADVLALSPDWSLGWMRPPLRQPDTRLVAMLNPRAGRLVAEGWEKSGPVTRRLELLDPS